jgi:hypothetical protein
MGWVAGADAVATVEQKAVTLPFAASVRIAAAAPGLQVGRRCKQVVLGPALDSLTR